MIPDVSVTLLHTMQAMQSSMQRCHAGLVTAYTLVAFRKLMLLAAVVAALPDCLNIQDFQQNADAYVT